MSVSLDAVYGQAGAGVDVQSIVSQYAQPGILSSESTNAMAAFAGGTLNPDELSSVLTGAGQASGTEGNPFLAGITPELMGAIGPVFAAQPELAAAGGLLAGSAALIEAAFTLLGWNAQGVNTGASCGNINLSTGVVPAGPNDHSWNPYPWTPGEELPSYVAPDGQTYASSFPTDPAQSNQIDSTYWAEFQRAPADSFRRFCYGALLANAALEWNCQPQKVNEQSLILHCLAEWNASHDSDANDYTIQAYEGSLGWNYVAPIELYLGRSGYTQGMSAGDQLVHGGALRLPLASYVTSSAVGGVVAENPAAKNALASLAPRPSDPSYATTIAIGAYIAKNPAAMQIAQGVQWAAKTGDPVGVSAQNQLAESLQALMREPHWWVAYYSIPQSKRIDPLRELSGTMSRGKVQAVAGLVSERAALLWNRHTKGLIG